MLSNRVLKVIFKYLWDVEMILAMITKKLFFKVDMLYLVNSCLRISGMT